MVRVYMKSSTRKVTRPSTIPTLGSLAPIVIITLFISITLFYGIDNIQWNIPVFKFNMGIFHILLSIP